MKNIIFITLLILIAGIVGCSFTDTDNSVAEISSLRLLKRTNGDTTLSHPQFDDWSPQMAQQSNVNYLYFLSKRDYTGTTYNSSWISTNKPAGSTAVFRAKEISPGVFSNLQMIYEFATNITVVNITAISNVPGSFPLVWVSYISNTSTNLGYIKNNINNSPVLYSSSISGKILGGAFQSGSDPHIFLGEYDTVTKSFPISPSLSIPFIGAVFKPYFLSGSPQEVDGNSVVSIRPELKDITVPPIIMPEINKRQYHPTATLRGVAPRIFSDPNSSQTKFGFYVSMDGLLCMLIHLNCSNFSDYGSKTEEKGLDRIIDNISLLQDQRLIPLFSVTHYNSTIDKDPCFHKETGLYFASNRAKRGVFNLYYVPKKYLALPADVFGNNF